VRRLAVIVVTVGSACGRYGFDAHVDAANTGDGIACGAGGPDAGLVAWWRLDEGTGTTVGDSVGATTGMFEGGPITWQPGICGSALQFIGNGSVIDFGTPTALANLAGITVSAWVQPSSVTPNAQSQGIVDKGDPAAGWTFEIAHDADGDFSFVVLGAMELRRTSIGGLLDIAPTWSHIVVTWDGSRFAANIHLYLGGSEVAYGAASDGGASRADDAGVSAALDANTTVNYAGSIDEVRIYSRALTAAEVAQL
jgi:hypothetical protein